MENITKAEVLAKLIVAIDELDDRTAERVAWVAEGMALAAKVRAAK